MIKDDERIIEKLKEEGYIEKLINYEEFLRLYKPYKNIMSEKNFAYVLGILESNYKSMKNKGTRVKILKNIAKLSKEQIQEIKNDLRRRGFRNKKIDYIINNYYT